jgi:hypothetical protein
MKSTLYALLVGVLFIALGCKKDKLTKATQKGKNTFSCKINGRIFKPLHVGGLFSGTPNVLSARNNAQYNFSVHAKNQETSESIGLENPYITSTGVYKLKADHPNRGWCDINTGTPGSYVTDSLYVGELTITRCDNVNRIYSGTFFFTARDPNTGATIKVTDGRFDVKGIE